MPDDDPIGHTGVRGAVRLGVHRGGGHYEIVPLQRRHHRPIVEDAFLLAYLLTIHKTRYAVFVLDDLWDDVLGAVFVGTRRVGQQRHAAPVAEAYLRRPVPYCAGIHALGLQVPLYKVRRLLEGLLVVVLFRDATDEGVLVLDARHEAHVDTVHQPIRHLDVEVATPLLRTLPRFGLPTEHLVVEFMGTFPLLPTLYPVIIQVANEGKD